MAERTMIERVARAIDAVSDEVSMAFVEPNPLNDQNVQRYCDADRAKRTRQARAAVEAMRIENVVYWVDGFPHASPKDVDWNERIDAALKE